MDNNCKGGIRFKAFRKRKFYPQNTQKHNKIGNMLKAGLRAELMLQTHQFKIQKDFRLSLL
jgi:hypothetical protein